MAAAMIGAALAVMVGAVAVAAVVEVALVVQETGRVGVVACVDG